MLLAPLSTHVVRMPGPPWHLVLVLAPLRAIGKRSCQAPSQLWSLAPSSRPRSAAWSVWVSTLN